MLGVKGGVIDAKESEENSVEKELVEDGKEVT